MAWLTGIQRAKRGGLGRTGLLREVGGSRRTSQCRVFFFFQAEDGIRDVAVTGVQTCAPSDLQPETTRRIDLKCDRYFDSLLTEICVRKVETQSIACAPPIPGVKP